MICSCCGESAEFYPNRSTCKGCYNMLRRVRHPERYKTNPMPYIASHPRCLLKVPEIANRLSDEELAKIAEDSAGLLLLQAVIKATSSMPWYQEFLQRAEDAMY